MIFGELFPASHNMYIFRFNMWLCQLSGSVILVSFLGSHFDLLQILIFFALAAPTQQCHCHRAMPSCMYDAINVHTIVTFQGGGIKQNLSSRATLRCR
jgi:hypothetical protein